MSCSTSFNFSGPTSQISHRDMECSKAIQLIDQVDAKAPDEYITHVEITRKTWSIFQRKETYKILSHKKFHCLLECAAYVKNESEYIKCQNACSAIKEQIQLNRFDYRRVT